MELPVPCAELISVRSAVRIIRGIIEVHHIVPISQIGKEYEVDPINDLVPLCPNCHTALPSKKKDGIYTIEELTELMNKTHRELYSDESVVASYEKYLNEVGK